MPAKSAAQQKAAGAALGCGDQRPPKRGEQPHGQTLSALAQGCRLAEDLHRGHSWLGGGRARLLCEPNRVAGFFFWWDVNRIALAVLRQQTGAS
jgi:hypothetical protein